VPRGTSRSGNAIALDLAPTAASIVDRLLELIRELVLVTGQGALPYLSAGPITSPERWAQIIRAFEGNFFQFAVGFN